MRPQTIQPGQLVHVTPDGLPGDGDAPPGCFCAEVLCAFPQQRKAIVGYRDPDSDERGTRVLRVEYAWLSLPGDVVDFCDDQSGFYQPAEIVCINRATVLICPHTNEGSEAHDTPLFVGPGQIRKPQESDPKQHRETTSCV